LLCISLAWLAALALRQKWAQALPDSKKTTVTFQPFIGFFAVLVWTISGDRER
jgi:hypothetical protein